MTWTQGDWIVVGVALGVVHAAGIWRSAKHASAMTAIIGLARLLVVGFTLAASAIFGAILPATGGWALGLFTGIAAVLASRRQNSQRGEAP